MKAKSITEIVIIALTKPKVYVEFTLSRLPIKQARMIQKYTGINLVGSERILDTDHIRHTLNEHGSGEGEASRGQISVTVHDFNKIPFILKEPDSIEYAGKNKRKQDVFLFKKKIKNTYVVAECVRFAKSGNKLIFSTMFKTKK